jgi:hypothetical protein
VLGVVSLVILSLSFSDTLGNKCNRGVLWAHVTHVRQLVLHPVLSIRSAVDPSLLDHTPQLTNNHRQIIIGSIIKVQASLWTLLCERFCSPGVQDAQAIGQSGGKMSGWSRAGGFVD